jgi:hypothetical protein
MKKWHLFELAKTNDYYDVMNLVAKSDSILQPRRNIKGYLKRKIKLWFINLIPDMEIRDKLIQKKIYQWIWK